MNSFFRFKQFIIHQDKSAMKVCTDACILGAWVADKLSRKNIAAKNILDIGTGTALLGLMLAQKSSAEIDAVEIDENAFLQATENISSSPWPERIKTFHASITDFSSTVKYDLIISNPPFYENDLRSDDLSKNVAMHSELLGFAALSASISAHLSEEGHAAVLLPFHRVMQFEQELKKENLFVVEKLDVAHSPTHSFFRSLLLISRSETAIQPEKLFIRDEENNYSRAFTFLLKDYYLNL